MVVKFQCLILPHFLTIVLEQPVSRATSGEVWVDLEGEQQGEDGIIIEFQSAWCIPISGAWGPPFTCHISLLGRCFSMTAHYYHPLPQHEGECTVA